MLGRLPKTAHHRSGPPGVNVPSDTARVTGSNQGIDAGKGSDRASSTPSMTGSPETTGPPETGDCDSTNRRAASASPIASPIRTCRAASPREEPVIYCNNTSADRCPPRAANPSNPSSRRERLATTPAPADNTASACDFNTAAAVSNPCTPASSARSITAGRESAPPAVSNSARASATTAALSRTCFETNAMP